MASQTPIAVRYLGLVPTLKGFDKNLSKELNGSKVRGIAGSAGGGIGSRLVSGMSKTLKVGALAAGGAVAGILGTAVVKGFNRLNAIENAEAKLKGLGNSAGATSAIMSDALAAVKGTAFGMDEAATTAASAVAAGLKPGKELESYLRLVGDAATIAGTDMSSMGSIFNKVATSGKVQGDVFAQLSDMGIPIVQLLADTMGKSAEEVYKLGSSGDISSQMFLDAMSSMSGAALEGGNTTSGAFKNMGAALSRFGATLLTGVYPLIGPFFNQITALIDGAAEAVTPFLERIQPLMEAGAQKVLGYTGLFTESLGGILTVLREGDFDPSKWAEGVEEDHPLVSFALNVREGFLGVKDALAQIPWGEISAFLSPIVSGFQALAPVLLEAWQNLSPLSLIFEILRPVLPEIASAVGELAQIFAGILGSALQAVLPAVSELVGALGPLVAELVSAVLPAVLEVASGLGVALIPVIQAVGPLLSTVVGALVPILGQVVAVAGPLVSMLASALAPVLVVVGAALGGLIQFLTPIIGLLVRFAPLILGVVAAIKLYNIVVGVMRLVALGAALAQTTFSGAVLAATLGVVRQRVATIAANIAQKAMAIGTKAAAAAQWLLNAAMSANPIGLIIAGIALLVGGLVLFFTKTETGRKIWETVWGAIKAAAAAVADWFMNTLVPAFASAWEWIKGAAAAVADWFMNTLVPILKAAWEGIAAGAVWLYQNIIQPVWTGIKTVIAIVVTAVLVYIDLLKWYWSNVLAPVALWLYNSVIKPVWNAIKLAIQVTIDWIVNVGWPILKAAWDAIAAAARWLYQAVILPVWNAIKSAIEATVNWIKNVGWPGIQLAVKWIGDGFKWLYNNVILPVWNAIRAAIDAVVAWFKNTAWPLINTVIGWLKMSFDGWKLIAQTVWRLIQDAIRAVVSWFRDTAWPIVRSAIEALKTGFNLMRDSIKNAWNFVKDRVIAPVANWFRDTVQPLFKKANDGVKDSFNALRDAIQKAWEKIKETAKEPIRFVIEDIIRNGIVDKYNTVASTFGVGTIDRNKFTVGWSSGGYTGPGAKYTPAGVVHADEYVIRKESQRSLRAAAPGLLDDLNRRGAAALEGRMAGYASGGWVKPFRGNYRSNSPYGMRGGRLHAGMDFPTPSGTPMIAVSNGTIVGRAFHSAAGNKISLQTDMPGIVAGYHHLSRYGAALGQKVSKGDVIGYSGNTGRSTGPHLHFSIARDGSYTNPSPYLSGAGVAGTGEDGGLWNPFEGIWDSLKAKVREGVGNSPLGDMLFEVPQKLLGGAVDWATRKLAEVGDWASDQIDGAMTGLKATRWTPTATRALTMEGEFSKANLQALLRRMNQESGYNPRAINNWDSNAKRGTPSKGLMQVIDPTFRAYARPGYNKDIYDPLSNILASIRYARSTYGSLTKAYNRKGGYADGGYTGPGPKYAPAGIVHADEHVIRKESRASIERARPGFLDRLNARGAAALRGYADGGRVSPTAKIGSTKVTVILDGLLGTEKQVKAATGKLADGISKTLADRFKGNQKATISRLSDSLKALNAQQSQLKKTMTLKSSEAKKSAVNRLSDDLAGLRKQAKSLDPKKQAGQLAQIRRQIDSTQSALTKARRGDYSAAAAATAAKLKDVQKQISSTEAALKAARSGNTSAAATKAADAFFNRYAASATSKLQSLAKRSDELNAKLKTANASLAEQVKLRDEYAGSMTEKFAGSYALSADSATTGIETIIRGFKNAAATVTAFSGQLAALRKRGLSDDLVDQVAQLGAADGSKVAANLLTGSGAQIKAITAQYNALNRASVASGKSLGAQMYQSGVDTAKGYVNGLTAQLKAVDAASARLANTVVSTVRKQLGIRSPSRVMDELAGYTVDGYVNRIEAETSRVREAMVVMQTAPSGGDLDAPSGARPVARRGVTITGGNFGYQPDEIARGINQEDRRAALLYNY